MENDFFASHLEELGIRVVRPRGVQIEELQRIVYEELTLGVVTDASRESFLAIASECRGRGGDVVGLCCTEFGMYFDDREAPWPSIDSTEAHVRALLDF